MRLVTPNQILARLPTYRDEWQLVKRKQYVPDIINEICVAHRLYEPYYDCFSSLFYSNDIDKVTESLYRYCKNFITYKAESVEDQTSALPTGIVKRKKGDCKHYSLFCAGVIDSLNRLYGCGFDWCYMFAGYPDDKGEPADEPYHVFVSVADHDGDIWLDPTPGSGGEPNILIPKYV